MWACVSVVSAALCVCSTERPFSFADDAPRPRLSWSALPGLSPVARVARACALCVNLLLQY